jgi:hypothetical protein
MKHAQLTQVQTFNPRYTQARTFFGLHLKLRRAEGGTKIFGVFRVKNHDFMQKKSYFFNCRGRRENF